MSRAATVSIIIPTLNEAQQIVATLTPLQALRARGAEVVLVDGGSSDNTLTLAAPMVDQLVNNSGGSTRGRAKQMNAGAAAANSSALLFLHADSWLPLNADQLITAALFAQTGWGRFDVDIRGQHPLLVMVAWFINQRSRLSGIATGDQGLFMTRAAFDAVGGFPDQPLMEDVEMCVRLKRLCAPSCLAARISTSGRRWEKHGLWRTILLMWQLRLRYALGASPQQLHADYYGR
jgi:rSAM/selenodomain-associated transferase 2